MVVLRCSVDLLDLDTNAWPIYLTFIVKKENLLEITCQDGSQINWLIWLDYFAYNLSIGSNKLLVQFQKEEKAEIRLLKASFFEWNESESF